MSAAEVPDGFTMGSSGADGGGASSEAAQKQAQRQAILEQVGGCVERCPIQRCAKALLLVLPEISQLKVSFLPTCCVDDS